MTELRRQRALKDLPCLSNKWDDFSLDACYYDAEQELVLKLVMPETSWFAIGFGSNMEDTDMIAWFNGDGNGFAKDYWSSGYGRPAEDAIQNIRDGETPKFDANAKTMTFVTRRPLDTGDSEQDFLVKLDEAMPMCYAYRKGTS